jgi:hypothetical protein
MPWRSSSVRLELSTAPMDVLVIDHIDRLAPE